MTNVNNVSAGKPKIVVKANNTKPIINKYFAIAGKAIAKAD